MNEHQQETLLPIALALLRDNELAISALYGEYALLFPTQASFWLTLAEEEQQHATWIGGPRPCSEWQPDGGRTALLARCYRDLHPLR